MAAFLENLSNGLFDDKELESIMNNLDQVIPLYNQALKALIKTEYLIPEK
jgi:hypothetical protein